MQTTVWLRHALALIVLFTLISCGGGGGGSGPPPANTPQRGDLVSATAQNTYTQSTLAGLASTAIVFPSNQASLLYDVNTYRLVYWTIDPAGNPIRASGLLAVPQKSMGSTALLSYQHGTIFHDSEAPTNNLFYNQLAAQLASMDFIVTMPDYIGYGESAAALHTYMHAESLTNATIDLLRAARAWLNSNSITLNNQLFVAGYSEGAYTSIATHRAMQQQLASEFSVTASAPGAGAYDMSATANTLLNGTTLPFAPYVAFVFKAYDDIYGYNRISDIFQTAYVDPVNTHFYGNHTTAQVSAAFNTNVSADLFTTTFLADYRGTGETDIKNHLMENNVYNWNPQAPVRLFHGQADPVVPYANATTAQSTMTNNVTSDVTVIDCPAMPADHANCYYPYLDYMAGYFLTF